MKKFIFSLIFLIFLTSLMAQDNLYINGNNDLNFIYKVRKDSLNTYFDNEFGFNMSYGKFAYGMKFIAKMPQYNNFINNQYLSLQDLSYKWAERYLSFESENLFVLGGLYEETFGNGILLSTVYDKDFDIDTRITGSQMNINYKSYNLKAIYGLVNNDKDKNSYDVVYGLDLDKTSGQFNTGISALTYRKKHTLDNNFSQYNIVGTRFGFNNDIIELNLEADKLKEDASLNEFKPVKEGLALFGTANIYLKKFTLSFGYKNYDDFDIYVNDPPRLNHSDEPLSENMKAGKDEEGFLSEIRFLPNENNTFLVNYSEAWNNGKTIKLSDTYLKYEHLFGNRTLLFEFSNTERYEEPIKEWTKDTTPVISYDTTLNDISVHIKSQYKIRKKVHVEEESTENLPSIQTDFSYNSKSISFIFLYPFYSDSDIMKSSLWIGTELKTPLFQNSELTLFVGKEKGGKVCRNGVCKYQSQFSGIKLNISTNF